VWYSTLLIREFRDFTPSSLSNKPIESDYLHLIFVINLYRSRSDQEPITLVGAIIEAGLCPNALVWNFSAFLLYSSI